MGLKRAAKASVGLHKDFSHDLWAMPGGHGLTFSPYIGLGERHSSELQVGPECKGTAKRISQPHKKLTPGIFV